MLYNKSITRHNMKLPLALLITVSLLVTSCTGDLSNGVDENLTLDDNYDLEAPVHTGDAPLFLTTMTHMEGGHNDDTMEFTFNKHIDELASKPRQEDGLIFEDRVSEEIAIVSGVFSDTVLATGNETLGVGQSKSGDTLVQIKEGHTEKAKISIESKSGKFSMTGKNSLSVQLEQAMANHNSDLGLAIVDSSKAPKSLLKKMYLRLGENTHVVVVDIKNDNFQVLNLYYAILRELAIHERNRKTSGQEAAKIDSDQITNICEKAIVELTKLNAVKRNLRNSVAKGALDSASLIEIQQSEMIDSFRKIIREVKKGDTK